MRTLPAVVAFTWAAQLAGAQTLAARLARQVPAAIEASPAARSAFWGIEIFDLARGRIVYAHDDTHLFVPASNAKLFTAALALDRLGPDYRFVTRVLSATAPDSDGVIHGPVRLVGGGDPNLSARAAPYQAPNPIKPGGAALDPLIRLEGLADQVAAHGVKRIAGDIVGDDSWYVWEPYPEGWAVDDLQYDYGAPVSALTINDNTITLGMQPGAQPGELARLSLVPALEFYQIDNRIETVAARGERKIRIGREPGSKQLRVWGSLPVDGPGEAADLAIDDPAEYAALALRRALENRGIVVTGGVRARHLYPGEAAAETAGDPFELARHDSAPLIDDLGITAKVSQNLHAELALRAVGRARRGVGSREAGLEEMKDFLRQVGIAEDAYSFRDGSGLDRADLVTPRAIVALLRYMYESPNRQSWIGLLPIGGEDGTLARRFADGPAAGRIHAKTGSLARVASLSGYAQRRDGSWVAFSILANNFNAPAASIRGVIDRICTLILKED
ncbi:MAG TPA: D-alanyl-D-alanine carboxypeptidase/D-alanyl-D-alanine-endopeptidase [Bryobacteraceae bacterium]|nr:D-alanyl-D-alanine carboxypeptidase/D-alanyl-D-alanine-endopeptidase [Bryobacteraceae bacterium]